MEKQRLTLENVQEIGLDLLKKENYNSNEFQIYWDYNDQIVPDDMEEIREIKDKIGTEHLSDAVAEFILERNSMSDYSEELIESVLKKYCDYKNFFKGLSSFPVFKKKGKNELGAYFVKNGKKDFEFYRHKIKIPSLKFVRVKEYGYIPKNANIKSGTISKIADRYFLSLVIEVDDIVKTENTNTKGLGIDLGIKDTAICSDGRVFKNINKTKKVKKIKKKIKREQRRIARSIEYSKTNKIKLKELKNFNKKKLKVQRLFYRLNCIRDDYNNKIVDEITRTKLKYITIENLKVSNMMKNRHLSKAIQEQNFFSIRTKLINKCKERNIELRIVDIFYPSSKTCSCCGSIKKDLKLNDRIYKCSNCGLEIDRDYNASINLEKAKVYKVIA